MNIFETFRVAMSSIWANKMRSFLTMLGIIIGIASVITIMALGQGSQERIGQEFETFGVNRLFISLNWQNENVDIMRDGFTDSDIEVISSVFSEDIVAASPRVDAQAEVKTRKTTERVDVRGVYENYNVIEDVNLIKGRFIKKEDMLSQRRVAVIDKSLSKNVFNNENPLGKQLNVDIGGKKVNLTIIGIYEKPESVFEQLAQTLGAVPSTTLYCPVTTLKNLIDSPSKYFSFEVSVRRTEEADLIKNRIVNFIKKRKMKSDIQGEEYYVGVSAIEQMQQLDIVLGVISTVMGAIAAISLVVGGIGIMNIMLVSVTERTREIGIRKAIGATKRSILMQFLVESMIISGIGGIAGTLFGVGVAAVAGRIMGFEGSVNIAIVIIAVSFSCGVGIFFGIYPANKAANMDPIEALRYE
ncbi:putative ABC transport system permease protein [Peptoclostridium litorale DSM 5388]|uniref:Macrolide export ATP-binding/permease protein MacB n=1 Tax=Peptoclostridium litorale DSM 5388 TaxID=1121324 RepID=A0A069RLF8_PEPLI|nr:ABC transporter permease [Peptoclostridium litorale]KDR95037.1 macrolide export ATP-binding/permease protein MacB [Peptoclostridium litorale DSM 5388]SIN76078.1 putative ABC transport system permease protein [Peptoclostridium litorale DSM 5388]